MDDNQTINIQQVEVEGLSLVLPEATEEISSGADKGIIAAYLTSTPTCSKHFVDQASDDEEDDEESKSAKKALSKIE